MKASDLEYEFTKRILADPSQTLSARAQRVLFGVAAISIGAGAAVTAYEIGTILAMLTGKCL